MIGSTAGRRRLDPPPRSVYPRLSAGVAKLVDARDLKSLGLGRAGSTPAARTKWPQGVPRLDPSGAMRRLMSSLQPAAQPYVMAGDRLTMRLIGPQFCGFAAGPRALGGAAVRFPFAATVQLVISFQHGAKVWKIRQI